MLNQNSSFSSGKTPENIPSSHDNSNSKHEDSSSIDSASNSNVGSYSLRAATEQTLRKSMQKIINNRMAQNLQNLNNHHQIQKKKTTTPKFISQTINSNYDQLQNQKFNLSVNKVFEACKTGNINLLKNNLQPEFVNIREPGDQKGSTPLHIAAGYNNAEIVKLLLKTGANINAKDKGGLAPIHNASCYGHIQIIDILIENHCDIDSVDEYGYSALHEAAAGDHYEVVLKLLQNNCNYKLKTKDGQTAYDLCNRFGMISPQILDGSYLLDKLFVALKEGNIQYFSKYLNPINANLRQENLQSLQKITNNNNFDGRNGENGENYENNEISETSSSSFLHIACGYNQFEALKLLLRYEANIQIKDKTGRTPLHNACYHGHLQIVKELVAAGADINAVDNWQYTALHEAAINFQKDICYFLIDIGADITMTDIENKTALDLISNPVTTTRNETNNNNNNNNTTNDSSSRSNSIISSQNLGSLTTAATDPSPSDRENFKNEIDLFIKANKLKNMILDNKKAQIRTLLLGCFENRAEKELILYHHPLENYKIIDLARKQSLETGDREILKIFLDRLEKIENQSSANIFSARSYGAMGIAAGQLQLNDYKINNGSATQETPRLPLGRKSAEGGYLSENLPYARLDELSQLISDSNKEESPTQSESKSQFNKIPKLPIYAETKLERLIIHYSKTGQLANLESMLEKLPESASRVLLACRDVHSRGSTPLHCAAGYNHINIIKYLLKNEVDVNAKDNGGMTPLNNCVTYGHRESLELLIEKGADIFTEDQWKYTLLHEAAERNNFLMCKILVNHVENYFANLELTDAQENNSSSCPYNSTKSWIQAKNCQEFTAADIAYYRNNIDLYDYLRDDDAVLDLAKEGDLVRLQKILTPKNVNCTTAIGRESTPLHLAAGYNKLEVAKLLLKNGAKVDFADKGGLIPLHNAASFGHYEMTHLLITAGSNINAIDNYGFTVLHEAAKKGRTLVCSLLLASGADANAKNLDGQTPVDLVDPNIYTDLVLLLQDFMLGKNKSNLDNSQLDCFQCSSKPKKLENIDLNTLKLNINDVRDENLIQNTSEIDLHRENSQQTDEILPGSNLKSRSNSDSTSTGLSLGDEALSWKNKRLLQNSGKPTASYLTKLGLLKEEEISQTSNHNHNNGHKDQGSNRISLLDSIKSQINESNQRHYFSEEHDIIKMATTIVSQISSHTTVDGRRNVSKKRVKSSKNATHTTTNNNNNNTKTSKTTENSSKPTKNRDNHRSKPVSKSNNNNNKSKSSSHQNRPNHKTTHTNCLTNPRSLTTSEIKRLNDPNYILLDFLKSLKLHHKYQAILKKESITIEILSTMDHSSLEKIGIETYGDRHLIISNCQDYLDNTKNGLDKVTRLYNRLPKDCVINYSSSTKLYRLPSSDEDYKMVYRLLIQTIANNRDHSQTAPYIAKYKTFEIFKIERVLNKKLWAKYTRRQQEIREELDETEVNLSELNNSGIYTPRSNTVNSNSINQSRQSQSVNERLLFHGSPALNSILRRGFDERYSCISGMFGAGIYFAEHSSKSNNYVYGLNGGDGGQNPYTTPRQMLLCHVTLGRQAKRNLSDKHVHAPPGCHSLYAEPSDDHGGLKFAEHVIYRGEQAYPSFLVTYRLVK